MTLAGYVSGNGSFNYFFRTTDNPEVRGKITEFLTWAKEKNFLELSDVPEAKVASPMWEKYVAPKLATGLDSENIDVEGAEDDGKPVGVISTPTGVKRGRGRPRKDGNTPVARKASYVPTGKKRGRPAGSKNKPKF